MGLKLNVALIDVMPFHISPDFKSLLRGIPPRYLMANFVNSCVPQLETLRTASSGVLNLYF